MGAELPRGAQMGKLGPEPAFQQPFCLAAKQPPSALLPLTSWASPFPRNRVGEADELLSHPPSSFMGFGG